MAYDIARALDNPNIIANGLAAAQAGRQAGQQNALARIASQAYTSPAGEQRNALIGQAVGVDPQAGMAIGNQLAARDSAQLAAQQATETDHAKKLGGAARYMAQALQSNNPAQVQGAWQAVRPYLAQLTGKEPPAQWDPAMKPALYQAIAATGGEPEQRGVVLSAGGQLRNPMTGELLADNPQSLQYHDVPMGAGKAAGVFDPSTGEVRPAVGGIQPAGDPMQPFIDQANQAVQLGADPAKVEQWLAQQAQQIGAQPQGGTMGAPEGGSQLQTSQAVMPAQFGVGAPRPASGGTFTQLSPDEVAQLGLPAGTVAQRGENGKIDVVSQPKALSLDKQADIAAKRQKAAQARDSSVATMDDSIRGIDTLIASPGFASLGTFTGDIATRIPHTDAADAKAQLDTVGNRSVLDTLSALKSLSATGASGFGALSEKEGDILRNAAANLNTSQKNEALKKNLLDLREKLVRARDQVAGQRISLPEDQVGGAQSAPPASGGWSATRVN